MDFFSLFKNKKTKSKDEAKNRLQLVLIHDRANVSPEFLEMLKGELLQVLLKYVEINNDEFDIQLTRVESEDGSGQVPALVANIPITRMKRVGEADKSNNI